jgi:hypothetical protein
VIDIFKLECPYVYSAHFITREYVELQLSWEYKTAVLLFRESKFVCSEKTGWHEEKFEDKYDVEKIWKKCRLHVLTNSVINDYTYKYLNDERLVIESYRLQGRHFFGDYAGNVYVLLDGEAKKIKGLLGSGKVFRYLEKSSIKGLKEHMVSMGFLFEIIPKRHSKTFKDKKIFMNEIAELHSLKKE